MKLPNYEQVHIARAKIVDYLLSATHHSGRGKAGFFTKFGFSPDSWEVLAQALKDHAASNDVNRTEPSPFGARYIIEGELQTPVGRAAMIRAVWFLDTGENVPRFVTAYPLRFKESDDDPGT